MPSETSLFIKNKSTISSFSWNHFKPGLWRIFQEQITQFPMMRIGGIEHIVMGSSVVFCNVCFNSVVQQSVQLCFNAVCLVSLTAVCEVCLRRVLFMQCQPGSTMEMSFSALPGRSVVFCEGVFHCSNSVWAECSDNWVVAAWNYRQAPRGAT